MSTHAQFLLLNHEAFVKGFFRITCILLEHRNQNSSSGQLQLCSSAAEKQLPVVGDDTLNPILASKSSHAVGQDSGWEAGNVELSTGGL